MLLLRTMTEPAQTQNTEANRHKDPCLDADDTDAVEDSSAACSTAKPEQWGAFPLVISFICCGFTGGIIPGQALFVQFFADAHTFAELCPSGQAPCDIQMLHMNKIIGSFYVLMIGMQFACGGLFDLFGGRVCGILGSAIVSLSYLGIALMMVLLQTLPAQSYVWSNLVMFGVAIADTGAWLNNYALLGMIWHYPSHQKLVVALLNAAYQVGSLYALMAGRIMVGFNLTLPQLMAGWACVQMLASLVLRFTVPSHSEYLLQAQLISGVAPPNKSETGYDNVRAAWDILMMDWWPHTLLAFTCVFGQAFTFYYTTTIIPFGTYLLGSVEAGKQMGNFGALANGIVCLISAPFLGFSGDRFGFAAFMQIQLFALIVFTITFWVGTWPFACVAVVSGVVYTVTNFNVSSFWFVHFAPPNRMGLVLGLWYLLSSLIFFVLQFSMLTWSSNLPDGIERFMLPLVLLGALAVFSALFFEFYFMTYPIFPERPRVWAEDESMQGLNVQATVYGVY